MEFSAQSVVLSFNVDAIKGNQKNCGRQTTSNSGGYMVASSVHCGLADIAELSFSEAQTMVNGEEY